MAKKRSEYDDEIDLFDLIKSIWDGKFQIILITFVAIAIGLSFNYYQNYNQKIIKKKPDTFEIILNIKPSLNSNFVEFYDINEIIVQNILLNNIYKNEMDGLKIYNRFIENFKNHEMFLPALKNNITLKNTISHLSEENQQIKFHDYMRLFSIKKLNDKKDEHVINFRWNNIDEGKKILEETMNLMIENLEKSIFNEVYNILKIQKNMYNDNNLSKIEYLLEQSAIAKELNILRSDMKEPYYLRGYIAIDKEIDLIRSRSNRKLEATLKKMKNLENKNEIKWISHGPYSSFINISNKNKNKKQMIMMTPITILGLIIGIFYVLFVNKLLKSRKFSRKK